MDFLRNYGYVIGGAFALWTLFWLTVVVNLWNLARRYRKEGRAVQPTSSSSEPEKYAAKAAAAAAPAAPAARTVNGKKQAWAE